MSINRRFNMNNTTGVWRVTAYISVGTIVCPFVFLRFMSSDHHFKLFSLRGVGNGVRMNVRCVWLMVRMIEGYLYRSNYYSINIK